MAEQPEARSRAVCSEEMALWRGVARELERAAVRSTAGRTAQVLMALARVMREVLEPC